MLIENSEDRAMVSHIQQREMHYGVGGGVKVFNILFILAIGQLLVIYDDNCYFIYNGWKVNK